MTKDMISTAVSNSAASDKKRDLGTFVLPQALVQESVAFEDMRLDSESYTSRIYKCCE